MMDRRQRNECRISASAGRTGDPVSRVVKRGMDNFQIEPPRPLAPLYRPGERIEISAAGLIEWYRSPSFKRVADFYKLYPSRSLFNDYGRALLHHLIVMQRPERVLEIGTMYAGTTEVLARGLWEAGHGHVDTIDP